MIQWFALALSLTGIFMNAKKILACWPVWILSNMLWIVYVLTQPEPDYATLCLWIVFMLSNIYGWVQWEKSSHEKSKRIVIVSNDPRAAIAKEEQC